MPHAARPRPALSATLTVLLAVASSPAFAMSDQKAEHDGAAQPPLSVLAFDQKLKGDTIQISYVNLPESGYVAIFHDLDGKRSDKALGFMALDKGNHNDVSVKIDGPVAPGTTLWASLYKDVDGDKALDLKKDLPLWPNGDPEENRFMTK
jgi:hypothetical protein